ncbi:CoA transferase, partial [Acinetobacter baumannii]
MADDPAFDRQMDPQSWPILKARTAALVAERTLAEWEAIFPADACVAPVRGSDKLLDDPHLAARGSFVVAQDVLQPAPGPRFSRTPGAIANPP